MKITTSRNSFLAELQIVSRATAVRSAVQTLSGVLLEAEDSSLRLAATDGEIGLRSGMEATVERLVSVESGRLRMVATDSYRLSVKETALSGSTEAFEANVPARALQELTRVVNDTSAEEVSAGTDANQIVFRIERVTLSSRMIDGQFPNYQ